MSFSWTYGSMTPEAKIRRTSRSRRSCGTRPWARDSDTHEEALSGLQLIQIIASVNAIDGVGGEIRYLSTHAIILSQHLRTALDRKRLKMAYYRGS
jgi:hypothetical protein